LYANGHISAVACWADVRRNFYDIHIGAKQSPLARETLEQIAKLYAIGKPPDLRRHAATGRGKATAGASACPVHRQSPTGL
jgi:hypothetical protein